MIKSIIGDLLECDAQYIAHQCNCVSRGKALGLARAIFDKFPYSDVYINKGQDYRDEPGTIIIRGNGADQRYVINMFGQYYPGGQNQYSNDNEEKRLEYFQSCLSEISEIEGLESIAFPENIGCAIAQGNWNKYYTMIESFANNLANIQVSIVRLPDGD